MLNALINTNESFTITPINAITPKMENIDKKDQSTNYSPKRGKNTTSSPKKENSSFRQLKCLLSLNEKHLNRIYSL